mgnify:CR=1 FL=1
MSTLVFNGWGYSADVWKPFLNSEFDLYPHQTKPYKNYTHVYAWSMGVLQALEHLSDFNTTVQLHLFSPCLSFLERGKLPGNSLESLDQMMTGLKKSEKTVLKLFHRKSKSKLSLKALTTEYTSLENGLIYLKETDLTQQTFVFPNKTFLYAASSDPIIPIQASRFFSEKWSIPLKEYDTFSHSFFLEDS